MILGKAFEVCVVAVLLAGNGGQLRGAQACSCAARPLCDRFSDAEIVLRAKAVSRSEVSSDSDMAQIWGDVTYTVEVTDVYKPADGDTFGAGDELTFTTKASSSLCGIYMDTCDSGAEYLLDLEHYKSESGDDELRAGLCGMYTDWSDVNTTALAACTATYASTQAIEIEGGVDDSPATQLIAHKGFVAACFALFVGCLIML